MIIKSISSIGNRIYDYCRSLNGTDRLLTIMLILLLVLLFFVALVLPAKAHDTHFDSTNLPYDINDIEHQSYIKNGVMVKTSKGTWLIYKHCDLTHSQGCRLHIEEVFEDDQCDTDMNCMTANPEKGDY